jgi:hypothetical protein
MINIPSQPVPAGSFALSSELSRRTVPAVLTSADKKIAEPASPTANFGGPWRSDGSELQNGAIKESRFLTLTTL